MRYAGIFERLRTSEDFVYERIAPNIAIKRMELKKQKKFKSKMVYQDYNFLQFVPVIRIWAQRNYDLTLLELDMLMYMYPVSVFSAAEFTTCMQEMGRAHFTVLKKLRSAGWVSEWSKDGRTTYYTLSQKANNLISRYHKMCMLEEEIPMSERRNVIVRSQDPKDKELVELFKVFNEKIKSGKQ